MFMFTVVGLFRVARATRDRTDGRRISAVRASGTPGFAARDALGECERARAAARSNCATCEFFNENIVVPLETNDEDMC